MKRLVAIIPVLLLILLFSCRMDPNLNGGNGTVYPDSHNWMSRLPGDTLLRYITVPGTHDTCANLDLLGLSSISSTQDLTLREQLDAGVRCIDIRITERDGGYGVYHGPVYMDMMVTDVVETCRAFLKENPTEFILMFMQYENGYYRIATSVLAELRDSDAELFFQGETLDDVTLSDVAGKVIPALSYWRRYEDPKLVNETDFWVPDDEWDYDKEDYWETDDPRVILQNSLNLMEKVRTDDRFHLDLPASYATSSYFRGQFGLPNYRIVSSIVNPAIQAELQKYEGSGAYFGFISVDHITRDLAHAIYSVNDLL